MNQRISLGTSGRFLHVSGSACFPDDRARLGDEYFPARRGFDGPVELHPDCGAQVFDERPLRDGISRQRRGHEWRGAHQVSAKPDPIRGEIEFRHLTFAYPTGSNASPDRRCWSDINLHIPAGSTLAIVGPTGSGKSRLPPLIARLWEAPAGNSVHRRRSIREYPLENSAPRDWIRAAGYVPIQRNDPRKHRFRRGST